MENSERVSNNNVVLSGVVLDELTYDHEYLGEKFYSFHIESRRLSDHSDVLPVIISERLVYVKSELKGKTVKIRGQFRSYNFHENGRNMLKLHAFAQSIEVLDDCAHHENHIALDCYICKEPVYHKTPLGRDVTDVLLAVNRSYGKSDYIPAIFWGRNATYIAGANVGAHLSVCGRIQSREYVKRFSDTESEMKIAYEVSVQHFETLG